MGSYKNLGYIDFEEMNLPPVLYKYRSWSNEKHKNILTKREIFLAPPGIFTDELDCRVPIRYDLLTDEEIFNWYFEESMMKNILFTHEQHLQFAMSWFNKGYLRDKERIRYFNEQFWNKFNSVYGILSLTAIPDNIKMWEQYANMHNGICVGFHTIPLFKLPGVFGGGGEVSYYDELPIIKATDPFEKQSALQIFSKLRKYEFEKEYRLTKMFNREDRVVTVPSDVFAEVIIGANVDDNEREVLASIVQKKFPQTKIKNSVLIKEKLELLNYQC